jgi:hypothetical protein
MLGDLPLPADLEAIAPGVIGTIVAEVVRIRGEGCKVLESLGFEALISDDG